MIFIWLLTLLFEAGRLPCPMTKDGVGSTKLVRLSGEHTIPIRQAKHRQMYPRLRKGRRPTMASPWAQAHYTPLVAIKNSLAATCDPFPYGVARLSQFR